MSEMIVAPTGAAQWWQKLAPGTSGPAQEIEGVRLQGAYDLLTALEILLPADCADCDQGFSNVMTHVIEANPDERIGLLAFDNDIEEIAHRLIAVSTLTTRPNAEVHEKSRCRGAVGALEPGVSGVSSSTRRP